MVAYGDMTVMMMFNQYAKASLPDFCKHFDFIVRSVLLLTNITTKNTSYSGFAGDSLLEQLKVEMIADSIEDFMVKPSVPIRREKDAEKKVQTIVFSRR